MLAICLLGRALVSSRFGDAKNTSGNDMKMMKFSLAAMMSVSATASAHPTQRAYAIPPLDAPALSALGSFAIGTQTITVASPNKVMLSSTGVSRLVRTIKARIWYPAVTQPGAAPTSFTHVLPQPDGKGPEFTIASLAVDQAPPVQRQRFPLVIISHGYNGWDSFMTWLTENLATKGYIVVAIDHADQRVVNPTELPVSFGNVLINRASDVRAVISQLTVRAVNGGDRLGQSIDATNIGLVGYSMGGFGVLGAAGLDYDPASPVFKQLPVAAQSAIFESQMAGKTVRPLIKAVVAMAPFGGRPESRVWTAAAIAAFTTPVMMIDGDHDDIVDAKHGVTWIFDQMASNRRHFLLYQNARHNVGGNPPPPEADSNFATREYFAEPVWRTERINAINQHFITAFLDLHLKHDTQKSAYLDVKPQIAGDGQWPLAAFENVGGRTATGQEPGFWRGFQRRWALGLEMRSGQPGVQ